VNSVEEKEISCPIDKLRNLYKTMKILNKR
jgi:hypothetical protein